MSITPVTCNRCGAAAAIRINRNGFLQRRIFGLVGLYPWKCGACGHVFLFRRRGHRPRSVWPDHSPDGSQPSEGSS